MVSGTGKRFLQVGDHHFVDFERKVQLRFDNARDEEQQIKRVERSSKAFSSGKILLIID
jgi:hypothetical protein